MPLRAGSMDAQITLQSATEAQDVYGEPIKTWANLGTNPTVWAEVLPPTGQEQFDAQQINALAHTTFRIRWRTDLNVEMRVVYDSVPYDIHAINELRRREGLELVTVARIQEAA